MSTLFRVTIQKMDMRCGQDSLFGENVITKLRKRLSVMQHAGFRVWNAGYRFIFGFSIGHEVLVKLLQFSRPLLSALFIR